MIFLLFEKAVYLNVLNRYMKVYTLKLQQYLMRQCYCVFWETFCQACCYTFFICFSLLKLHYSVESTVYRQLFSPVSSISYCSVVHPSQLKPSSAFVSHSTLSFIYMLCSSVNRVHHGPEERHSVPACTSYTEE